MRRIEAVMFASVSPVPREDLARVVGKNAPVDLLTDDLTNDLAGRSFEVAKVIRRWMMLTRSAHTTAVKVAADVCGQDEYGTAVLTEIAYHQPFTRDGLKGIFGNEISRDLIGGLHAQGLIGTGPRSP